MSKGIFIPDITVEMMRNASLEAVETLLVEGEMHDVDMPKWIPCSERLPEEDGHYIVYAPSYRGGSSGGKEMHNGVMFSRFKNGKWSIEVGYHKRPDCVKAWMPIVPWKGEKDD